MSEALPTLAPTMKSLVLAEIHSSGLRKSLLAIELAAIQEALDRAAESRTKAAEILGLNRTTLVEKMRKHGLIPPRHGAGRGAKL